MEPADLLLENGIIDIFDEDGNRTNALAIKDGVIVGQGELARDHQGVMTEVIDLGGRYVMPGLLDIHNHHMIAGQMDLFELEASPRLSRDGLLSAVADYADKLGPDEWLIGGSWGSGLLGELNSLESLHLLDEAAGGRPVLLKDDSKHNRWVNSRALELSGITESTPDPEGGEIMRDSVGQVTGVLLEAGGVIVEKTVQRLRPTSPEDMARAVARGVEILHSYGITGFQDAATSLQVMDALKLLDEAGDLHAWVVSSMQANDFVFGTAPLGEGIIEHRDRTRSHHHRPDFIKIFLDGVPPAGTAAFLEPYLEDMGFPQCHCGGTTMPPEDLEKWLMNTAERGISAKVHCTGDASVRLVLDTVQKVRQAGYEEVRYHIAHGQFVHPDDIPRFAELDVTADISPSLWFPGVISEAIASVLGEDRGRKLHPNRSLLDVGARLSGGSDWPVSESPNVWEGIYGLVTRRDPTGQMPGLLWPEQAITLKEAVRVYTTATADAMGISEVAGSLEEGKSADFIILDSDLFEMEIEEIPRIQVQQTWFAGRKVFDVSACAVS